MPIDAAKVFRDAGIELTVTTPKEGAVVVGFSPHSQLASEYRKLSMVTMGTNLADATRDLLDVTLHALGRRKDIYFEMPDGSKTRLDPAIEL